MDIIEALHPQKVNRRNGRFLCGLKIVSQFVMLVGLDNRLNPVFENDLNFLFDQQGSEGSGNQGEDHFNK